MEEVAGSGQDEFWRYFGMESTRLHDQCDGGGKGEGGIWITARFLSWVSGLMDGENSNRKENTRNQEILLVHTENLSHLTYATVQISKINHTSPWSPLEFYMAIRKS